MKIKVAYILIFTWISSSPITSQKITEKYPIPVIQRTKKIEGRFVNSIINNGGTYFLVDLAIYEDGVIDAWGPMDLKILDEKILNEWVSMQIPENEKINIHHLGSWEIKNASWIYNKSNYKDFIESTIKRLNPNFKNIFIAENSTSKVIGNSNYSVFGGGQAQLIRQDSEQPNFQTNNGKRQRYFYKIDEGIYEITTFDIYGDGKILISTSDGVQESNLENLINFKDLGILITDPSVGSKIIVKDLGEFEIGEKKYGANVDDKLDEIQDVIAKQNGKETTSEICRRIFDEYNASPSEELKQKLKTAYEIVPKHLRPYLGDMDSKDWPIKNIIYKE